MSVRSLILSGIVFVGCFIVFFAHRFTPSYLRVHVDPSLEWKSTLIESSNFKETRYFNSGSAIDLSPLEHGKYVVVTQFTDGRFIYFDFIHTDAGDSRWLDIDITPSASPDAVHVRASVNKWLRRRHVVEFDGDIRLDATSRESPRHLFGP